MRISSILKRKLITLETSEGDVELQLTEMSIGDNERYMSLIKPFLDKDNKVKKDVKVSNLTVARVMCSLKYLDGQYYFDGELESVNVNQYPPGMFVAMNDELSKLEPVVSDTPDKTLDTVKKTS